MLLKQNYFVLTSFIVVSHFVQYVFSRWGSVIQKNSYVVFCFPLAGIINRCSAFKIMLVEKSRSLAQGAQKCKSPAKSSLAPCSPQIPMGSLKEDRSTTLLFPSVIPSGWYPEACCLWHRMSCMTIMAKQPPSSSSATTIGHQVEVNIPLHWKVHPVSSILHTSAFGSPSLDENNPNFNRVWGNKGRGGS